MVGMVVERRGEFLVGGFGTLKANVGRIRNRGRHT